MSFLTGWLTNIIVLILLATILEMLIPESGMKRYVKLAVSILLLFLILQPVLSIFSVDIERMIANIETETAVSDQATMNLINLQKTEIENGQRAYISEQIAVRLREDANEALDRYDLIVTDVQVEWADQSELAIESVDVYVKERKDTSNPSPRIIVEEIDIRTSQPLSIAHREEEAIRKLLSERWQMPEETILLTWEGGSHLR